MPTGMCASRLLGLREFIEPRWQRRNLFPNDEWDRDLRGKLGAKPEGPEDQIAAMDEDGIDVMVLYPTAGLHVGSAARARFRHCHDESLQRLAVSFLQNQSGALEIRRACWRRKIPRPRPRSSRAR